MGKSVLNQCLCMSPYFIIIRWIQLMRQGLSSLRKLCLVGIRIPIINLGRWSVRLRFLGRFLYLSVYFYWTDLWCPCFAHSWASYLICNIVGCACAGNAGNVFPRHRLQGKPLVSDPGMHHLRDASAVMHVGIACILWRGKRSRHSRRMRIRNFPYLASGPLWMILSRYSIYVTLPYSRCVFIVVIAGDLGGSLGLYIGASFLTIFEFLDSCFWYFQRKCIRWYFIVYRLII